MAWLWISLNLRY